MSEQILELPDDVYVLERTWCQKNHITSRTSARYRNLSPGLPYLRWANKIWIGRRQGAEYIASLARRRNPRPEPRRRGQTASTTT
jgi:hypothetical protein